MTITLGWWMIPFIITLALMIPIITAFNDKSDRYGIGGVFSLLFLIPILLSWVIYLAIF